VSGLNSAILRTLAERSVLVRLGLRSLSSNYLTDRSCRLSAIKEDCFRLRSELDAGGPTLSSGGSLTAMLNLAEKLQPDIPTLAASEATFQAAFAFC